MATTSGHGYDTFLDCPYATSRVLPIAVYTLCVFNFHHVSIANMTY